MAGERILVIEDHPTNLELVCYLLAALGFAVAAADNGASGLELVARERFDLILLDVHMPGLDGLQVVAALKAGGLAKATPVIALTALAMLGDRERLLQAGFDGYISKPIEPEHFGEQVAHAIMQGVSVGSR